MNPMDVVRHADLSRNRSEGRHAAHCEWFAWARWILYVI